MRQFEFPAIFRLNSGTLTEVGLGRGGHEGPLDVADDALVGAGLVERPVVDVGGLAPVLDDADHDEHDEDEDDDAEADDRDEDVERLAVGAGGAAVALVPVEAVAGRCDLVDRI